MQAKSVDADTLFRVFTACPQDPRTLILDVRSNKEFKKQHVILAYNIRLSSNGKILADYSGASYDLKWSQDCWWNSEVFVYGTDDLKRDHPVLAFLSREGRCKALHFYKDGLHAFEKKFPFLVTQSTKQGSLKRYPSQILVDTLFLGDWKNAEQVERLEELNIKSVITIHNHPENLALPPKFKHLRFDLPDIESADISKYFSPTYHAIEEARSKGHAVLVHCGAGVSRSACLVVMYLMRHLRWNAEKARSYCVARRSLVCINDGFWRTLCALEEVLHITPRSDATAVSGFHGADAPELSKDAAGQKVEVQMITAAELKELERSSRRNRNGSPRLKRGRDGTVAEDHADRHAGGLGPSKRNRTSDNAAADALSRGKNDAMHDGSQGAMPASMPQRQDVAGGIAVVLSVSKPDGLVGRLTVGPMHSTQRCVFGRAPGLCDVVLEHLSISRQHAEVTVDATNRVYVTDLESGHGTKLDDTWIRPRTLRPLKVGSVLRFGASSRTYKVLSFDPC